MFLAVCAAAACGPASAAGTGAARGSPRLAVPPDQPLTAEKAVLGRKLFFDRRLSPNGTMSCGMCHVPEQGFTAH
jgi:cytochrome c peroxidase